MDKKTKQRKIPSQTRGHVRLNNILNSAEKLFAEIGYEKVTAQRIAKDAKISPGVLYHYFSGKHSIFASVLQRIFIRLEKEMVEIYQDLDSKDIEAILKQTFTRLLVFWRNNKNSMMLWQVLKYDPNIQDLTQTFEKSAIKRNYETIGFYFPKFPDKEKKIKALMLETVSISLLEASLNIPKNQVRDFSDSSLKLLIHLVTKK